MANTLRIKRRPSSGLAGAPSPASSLYNGELAFNENDNILYYAYGSGVGGVATSVPAIAGSGAYSLRGGTNASGLWPISVNGNSASVTNGVYTTGNQDVSGNKTFLGTGNFDSSFRAAKGESVYNVIFSPTQIQIGQGDIDVKLAGNSYYDPNGNYDPTKEIANKAYVTSTLSGITFTAGSGLLNGGTLVANRTFDVGQGDGISVSTDAIAVDSTVVRTTGDQTIGGRKRFSTYPIISGNLAGELVFQSAINTNGGNIIFDGVNLGSETSYIKSSTAQMNIAHGSKIQLDSALEVIAGNTAGNSVGYFAVFDTNPASSLTTLKSVSKDQILDDIGAATSGLTITAGSGLVGGGNLSTDRTFDVGQGDGISVSDNAIAVDSTVVRTTGTQTINGSKTFGNQTTFTSGIITPSVSSNSDLYLYGVDVINLDISNGAESAGIGCIYNASENQQFQCYDTNSDNIILSVGDRLNILSPNTAVSGTYFPVFTQNPNAGTSAILSRTASQLKGDIGLSNVTNDAQIKKLASTSGGFVPTWNGTTGDALNVGYSVETVLTGGAGALPRADAVKTYVDTMIGSGIATNDAMVFKGAIDCSTNPNYPAADRGWTYKVSVAGKIGGASGPVVEVNDTLICGTDSTPSGIHSVVGGNWNILQTNIVDANILVTGPSSATSGNFALFDGTTGKIIKDSGFAATTVGQNLVSLTNPSAISFIRMNANNTVSARTASELKTDLSLNNVENTALSTWAGTSNITTLGTVTTGTWSATTIAVNKGGTNQTSYTDGQLLIGNSTGNTLSKATLTQGTAVDITNGGGSITIGHNDTSTLTGAQGSNGIASFTVDGMGHVTAVTTATYLTAATVCAHIVDCQLDGGTF